MNYLIGFIITVPGIFSGSLPTVDISTNFEDFSVNSPRESSAVERSIFTDHLSYDSDVLLSGLAMEGYSASNKNRSDHSPNKEEPPVQKDPVQKNSVVSDDVSSEVPEVPFFSQSEDISLSYWKSRACGVASLAMIIEFHSPGRTSPQELLSEGLDSGYYLSGAGWTHQGLASLAHKYDLEGSPYDLSHMDTETAYSRMRSLLEKGPIIASVFHGFDPQSPIPHLVVVNGVKDGLVYFNDPDGSSGGGSISVDGFKRGWKKRFITAHP
ncbi:MAG: C39 family peptidase [Patescibacteria group bacterium]